MKEDQTLLFSGDGGSLLSCMVVATYFICHPEILIEQFWGKHREILIFESPMVDPCIDRVKNHNCVCKGDTGSEEDLFNIPADGNTETRNKP